MDLLGWIKGSKKGTSVDARPSFEQLEPRLLLNADFAGIDPVLSPDTLSSESVICVDFQVDQASGQENLPTLTIEHGQPFEGEYLIESSEVEADNSGPDRPATEEVCPDEVECLLEADGATAGETSGSFMSQTNCLVFLESGGSDDVCAEETAESIDGTQQETIASSETPSIEIRGPPTEVVFIDSTLNPYSQLENAGLAGIVVSVFDGQSNGLEHITRVLSSHHNLSAIHIVSHGDPGQVFLGTSVLDVEALQSRSDALSTWGQSLSDQGDILLYGCSVGYGQRGREFVREFATVTGADVAASTNPTGSAELGGDWQLELQAGTVETDHSLIRTYLISINQLLTTYTVDSTADNTDSDGLITLREAIEAANTNTQVGDAPAGSGTETDTVEFDIALNESIIELGGSELVISDNLSVAGPANGLTIRANSASRVLSVAGDTEAYLSSLVLTGGSSPDGGGFTTVVYST